MPCAPRSRDMLPLSQYLLLMKISLIQVRSRFTKRRHLIRDSSCLGSMKPPFVGNCPRTDHTSSAMCTICCPPHRGASASRRERFPRTRTKYLPVLHDEHPAFQRLAIVLHLTTSSVVNKGLNKLQIVPCSFSSIADKRTRAPRTVHMEQRGRPRLPQEGPKYFSEASAIRRIVAQQCRR